MPQTEEERRDKYYRQRFNITLADYENLLFQQREKCAVCNSHVSFFKKRLAVDHNHKTGEVRGLLCFKCNHFVIGRYTDPDLLLAAARYLTGPHTGKFVPVKKKVRKKRKSH